MSSKILRLIHLLDVPVVTKKLKIKGGISGLTQHERKDDEQIGETFLELGTSHSLYNEEIMLEFP